MDDPRRTEMKNHLSRSRSIAAAVAATFVTTVLVASLVESFDPAQLDQLSARANDAASVALEWRAEAPEAERA
jgi:hypothetical protein